MMRRWENKKVGRVGGEGRGEGGGGGQRGWPVKSLYNLLVPFSINQSINQKRMAKSRRRI